MELKEKLNEILLENNVTKYKLSKILKVNPQTVINWCNGTTEPKTSELKKICIYFDISADYLLGLEDYAGVKNNNQINKNIFIKM